MNRFGFNRSSLNGVVYALVLASASVSCSAAVNAVAIRQADALAPVSSAAYINADPTVTRYVSANFEGIGNLYPQATHTHASYADLSGNASITAYVLRSVQAQAMAQGVAEIVAVVASTMGNAVVASGAEIAVTATRVQAARSNAEAYASVTLTVAPTVYRMVSATATLGTASVRVEPSIWQIAYPYTLHSAYGDVTGTASLIMTEQVSRMAQAVLECPALIAGTATLRQPGSAVADANATLLNANPNIVAIPFVQLAGNATVIAQAQRVVLPGAASDTTASVSASALQKHSAGSLVNASVEVVGTPTAIRYAQETLQGNATVTTSAVRVLQPVVALNGVASVAATALRTVAAGAALDASALLTTTAVRGLVAQASLATSAEAQANGLRYLMPVAALSGGASMAAQATYQFRGSASLTAQADLSAVAQRFVTATANVTASAEIFADTVTNPASYDPDERTFYRTAQIFEFVRPFQETEFRRAA